MLTTLRAFLNAAYAVLRGDCSVLVEATGNDFRCQHPVKMANGVERSITIRCCQYLHTVYNHRWYWINSLYYTYRVELVVMDGDVCRDFQVAYYPHMCARWLVNTQYPHRYAIGAHLDAVNSKN